MKFAFEDGGLTNWADFVTNAGRTVEAGLTSDQALRALTLSAAEILGVSDRLGTIEAGKIGNLTLSRGDLFSGRVTRRFVDGAPVAVRATTPAAAGMANGAWQITVTLDEGEKPVTLTLTQAGDQLRGTAARRARERADRQRLDQPNGELSFRTTVTMDAGTEEARFAGRIEGNVIRGTVQIVGHPQGTFVGSKPDAAGNGRRGRLPEESI